jgi:hypothetical protein
MNFFKKCLPYGVNNHLIKIKIIYLSTITTPYLEFPQT